MVLNCQLDITSHSLTTLNCGLAAHHKPRAVLPPLPSPAPAAGCARRPSAPAACDHAWPSPVRPRKPRPWPDSPMDYYIQIVTAGLTMVCLSDRMWCCSTILHGVVSVHVLLISISCLRFIFELLKASCLPGNSSHYWSCKFFSGWRGQVWYRGCEVTQMFLLGFT